MIIFKRLKVLTFKGTRIQICTNWMEKISKKYFLILNANESSFFDRSIKRKKPNIVFYPNHISVKNYHRTIHNGEKWKFRVQRVLSAQFYFSLSPLSRVFTIND